MPEKTKAGEFAGVELAEGGTENESDIISGIAPIAPIEKVGFRAEDAARRLADVESILGEPIKKRRGRKPGAAKSQAEQDADKASEALKVAGIDAKMLEGTLTEAYCQILQILARVPLNVQKEKKEALGPLVTFCANKYIPGNYLDHAPLMGLAVISLDIVREGRKLFFEKSEEKKKGG